MSAQKKRFVTIILAIAGLLLIPFVAMQITDQVNWKPFDFFIMAFALLSVALAYELIARRSERYSAKAGKKVYRVAFGIGLAGAFLLFWVNGAVGIIGSENQTPNLLYGAVFLVGSVGALVSRFKANGMANTLFAAAITQMSVPVIALIVWPPPETSWSPGVFQVFVLTAFFAGMFLVSAVLFRRAAASQNTEQTTENPEAATQA